MRDLGIELSKKFRVGDIIVLHGPLGAGKTALTQGIGAGFGIEGITSPTFVISRIHRGDITLNHVDAYRLLGHEQSRFEFDDLDIETDNAVTIIEWGADVVNRLGSDYLVLEISFGADENQRTVSAQGFGQRWQGFSL